MTSLSFFDGLPRFLITTGECRALRSGRTWFSYTRVGEKFQMEVTSRKLGSDVPE